MLYYNCPLFLLIHIGLVSSIGSEYIKIQNKLCTPFRQLGGGNMSEHEAKRLCSEDIHCTKMFKKRDSHKFYKCTMNSTMIPYTDFILYSKDRFVCPDMYIDILDKSDFCFRYGMYLNFPNDMDTWETAKKKCMKENGDLPCLRSGRDAKKLVDVCNDCWIGYKRRDKDNLDSTFGAWKLDTSLTKTQCKDKFEIGNSAEFVDSGQCSRLQTESEIPYVSLTSGKCADSIETHQYICQKSKLDLWSRWIYKNGR